MSQSHLVHSERTLPHQAHLVILSAAKYLYTLNVSLAILSKLFTILLYDNLFAIDYIQSFTWSIYFTALQIVDSFHLFHFRFQFVNVCCAGDVEPTAVFGRKRSKCICNTTNLLYLDYTATHWACCCNKININRANIYIGQLNTATAFTCRNRLGKYIVE